MAKKLRKMKKAVAVTLAVAMSLISAGMAARAEDAPVKAADDRVMSEEVKNQLKAAADEFPEKLDLRDYDKDGDGKGENYVTPVKAQHPFGTCWAHGTIAAAEISYLFGNDLGTPAGTPNNNIDLSEKDFAWYYYHGITADDIRTDLLPASQAGEGFDYSEADAKDRNSCYNVGGTVNHGSVFFMSGQGPVHELDTVEGWAADQPGAADDHPYEYKGLHGWKIMDQNESDEAKEARKEYNYRLFSEYLGTEMETVVRGMGYTDDMDFRTWFDSVYEENIRPGTYIDDLDYYAPFDDWTLPLNARYRFGGDRLYMKESRIMQTPLGAATGIFTLDEDILWSIKNELVNGHGVVLAYFADQSRPGDEISEQSYMNTETWSQYTNNRMLANHAVCVVGYDDTYPRENFTRMVDGKEIEGSTPPGDGAFIVKNSWGSLDGPSGRDWGIDGSGYFYLSYYDQSVISAESYCFYTEEEKKAIGSTTIAQYDLLPAGSYISLAEAGVDYSAEVSKMANVFTAAQGNYLYSISVITSLPGTFVDYAVYKDLKDPADPLSGTLAAEGTEVFLYGGYQRIDLKEEVPVKEGEVYSVVVSEYCMDDGGHAIYKEAIPFTMATGGGQKLKGVINPNESFLLDGESWKDLTEYRDVIINTIWEQYNKEVAELLGFDIPKDSCQIDNFPIKAYGHGTCSESAARSGEAD